VNANWLEWLRPSPKSREFRETVNLYDKVEGAYQDTPLSDRRTCGAFVVDLIHEACERRGVVPSVPLGQALYETLFCLLEHDGFIIELPERDAIPRLTLEESLELRVLLRRQLRFIEDHKRLLPLWREKLIWVFSGLLEYLPLSAFTDIDEDGVAEDDSVVLPEAQILDLCDNLPLALKRLIATFYDADVSNAHLFTKMQERFDENVLFASGIRKEAFDTDLHPSRIKWPEDQKNQSPEYLVDTYLLGTPFRPLFRAKLPFAIPFPARFEHTHIVGGTGHGKTQLMQFLINHDLVRAQEDNRSIVVLDSQGDLIRTVSRLKYFSSDEPNSLADRFVLVDPNDVEHPVCLNMFDWSRDRLSGYAPVDREKILNATIELYEYFFGALLGAELTQRQGLIFRYLARLMMEIPDATIHTLRELMEDSEKFRPYMEKLGGTARSFFATQFFDRKFGETKKQILTRLWGVLSNSSLERMFSHTRNKIDMFELLNGGKIILINTAKDLLGQEGASIFGRFFIALIAQAAVQRAALPPHKRNPAFVYIDEAQDYFDDNISHLLNQARKYRVGLIFAHQNLDQLGAGLRSSVLASTTIKFAGGVSAKDASVLASELRCESDFLLDQKKEKHHTGFACHVRNYTSRALSITIPLGYVDRLPMLTYHEHEAILEENRERYSEPPLLPPEPSFSPTPPPKPSGADHKVPEPVVEQTVSEPAPHPIERNPSHSDAKAPVAAQNVSTPKDIAPRKPKTPNVTEIDKPEPGRGGKQHKYLQQLVKQLAEERKFRATIEETILGGDGRVDVSLVRGGYRIACQISVTTTKDWELGNVEKCIAAGYDEIVLIGSTERQVKALAKFIEENLDAEHHGKIRYAVPESIVEFLDSIEAGPKTTESEVRGYKVKVTRQDLSPEEIAKRRAAVAGVIARSIRRTKDT
jgi:hypothetical protein